MIKVFFERMEQIECGEAAAVVPSCVFAIVYNNCIKI